MESLAIHFCDSLVSAAIGNDHKIILADARCHTLFATAHQPDRERNELLDLFGEVNGIGPVKRASPKLLGSLGAMLLTKGGLKTLGRAMPLVAAPISAYLNNRHIQKIGEESVRFYDGWHQAHEKAQKASGM